MEKCVVATEFEAMDDDNLRRITNLFSSFQLSHKPTDGTSCPLCKMDLSKEHIYYESDKILIVDTNRKKGHRNRIMVLMKEHGVQHHREALNEAIRRLVAIGRQVFEEDFILLSDRYSSVNYHWHIIASDLNPEAEDHQQIEETPYVHIKLELEAATIS